MLTRFNASGCHGLRLAWVAWFCVLPDHGDAICPPVARAVATDHPQESGFAGAARVDLRAKVQQAFGGGLDLTRAELDRARVHLNAAGVSVVEHRAVQRLGQHPQVADHQRREQQSQQLQIPQESIRAAAEGHHSQGGWAHRCPECWPHLPLIQQASNAGKGEITEVQCPESSEYGVPDKCEPPWYLADSCTLSYSTTRAD